VQISHLPRAPHAGPGRADATRRPRARPVLASGAVAAVLGLGLWAGVADADLEARAVDGAAQPAGTADQLGPAPGKGPAAVRSRPNILFVLVDDMSMDQLPFLDKIDHLIADRGVTFERAFVPYPLCCPARATILSGQYPHNHGVMSNDPPLGGISAFGDRETLPVWLQRAGYTTMLIGKYLNHYNLVASYRPPGWTDWRGLINELQYRTWSMNRNGRIVAFDNRYQTTEMAAQVRGAIRRYGPRARPFFMYVSLIAPHVGGPSEPDDPALAPTPNVADRYRDAMASVIPPRPASFNEADVDDKPSYLHGHRLLDRAEMVEAWQQRTESLLSVDDAVASFVATLRNVGELDNTVVVFASDNGFLLGEHRWRGKSVPYEEAAHVPLLVRGPGFPSGVSARQLVSLVDLAPTFLRTAAGRATHLLDGAPLQGIAADDTYLAHRSIVLEGGVAELVPDDSPVDRRHRFYWGVRTPADTEYVRYATGESEFYDLRVDPAQLSNAVHEPSAQPAVSHLARLLARLRNCQGVECR
jgi:N-acetylglucosamine-6-sulfatase